MKTWGEKEKRTNIGESQQEEVVAPSHDIIFVVELYSEYTKYYLKIQYSCGNIFDG